MRQGPSATPPGRPAAAPDATPGALKGRGTIWAVAHRFERDARQPFDDGWGGADTAMADRQALLAGDRPPPATVVSEERVGRILSTNDSPDIGFDLSINPYRGCEHGCVYCYARPTHSYLNLSPGLDFETRIVAKVNAAERLREALSARGYTPRLLNLGSITDAYQPVERRLRLTRGVIEVLSEARHPLSIITKSSLVERDIDLLAPMAEQGLVAVTLSITTLDPLLARTMEPRAASPERRLRTLQVLAQAGIPVGVSVSPVIPFLNEPELERILAAARDAGARRAFSVVLRLPWEVRPIFEHWLGQQLPAKAARVMARVREMHGGRDYDAHFGTRMTGQGVWAQLLRQRFEKACAALGLNRERVPLDLSRFRPPGRIPGQGELF